MLELEVAGLRHTCKQAEKAAYCLKDYKGKLTTYVHISRTKTPPHTCIDQAVRLAVDFICPGFPAHFMKVEDDHMLFRLKDHIGKTPIIIMTRGRWTKHGSKP